MSDKNEKTKKEEMKEKALAEEEVQIPPSLEDEAEKPTKLPGKTRAGAKESYRPFHKK